MRAKQAVKTGAKEQRRYSRAQNGSTDGSYGGSVRDRACFRRCSGHFSGDHLRRGRRDCRRFRKLKLRGAQQEVLAYTATIQRYASEFGIPEYVASIQAIMMQESGGRGTDPMQASECPYNTEYPNTPGGITDPDYSIRVGIQYYADCVTQAGCESPADISRLQLSWQGYNYGNGYIGWALTNYGGYSLENALNSANNRRQPMDGQDMEIRSMYPMCRDTIPEGICLQACSEISRS